MAGSGAAIVMLGIFSAGPVGDYDPSPTFTVTSLATDPSYSRLLASTCAGREIDLPDE